MSYPRHIQLEAAVAKEIDILRKSGYQNVSKFIPEWRRNECGQLEVIGMRLDGPTSPVNTAFGPKWFRNGYGHLVCVGAIPK